MRIVSVAKAGSEVLVAFTTWQGKVHRLECASTLGGPIASDAVEGASEVPGTGGVVAVKDADPGGGCQGYYRVLVTEPGEPGR